MLKSKFISVILLLSIFNCKAIITRIADGETIKLIDQNEYRTYTCLKDANGEITGTYCLPEGQPTNLVNAAKKFNELEQLWQKQESAKRYNKFDRD